MISLFLFRHGETDWNVQERFQGHIDVPLNQKGRAQAQALVSVMNENGIEAILSSDLSRALETAQIIAAGLRSMGTEIPLFEDPRLREAHLGDAQGLTRVEVEKKFGITISRWRSPLATDADVAYPGGETGREVVSRAFQSLESFLEQQKFRRIGVASHGGTIRRIMQKLMGPDSPPVAIPNGVIYGIQYDPQEKRFFIP